MQRAAAFTSTGNRPPERPRQRMLLRRCSGAAMSEEGSSGPGATPPMASKERRSCTTMVRSCLTRSGSQTPGKSGKSSTPSGGGTGKGRAGRDGSLRASKTWRSQIISTGEMRVIDKIVEGGKRPRAGQEVRIVDIPADAGQGFGIFDHAGDCNDPEKLADSIKAAARTSYGTAGPAFVEGLLKKGADAVAKQIRAAMEAFRSANVDDAADGHVKRVANRFALAAAAGEIAIELGIVPWGAGAATTAAVAMYKAWLESRGGLEPVEIRNMIQQVRSLIERYGDSRFDPIEGAERPAHERYGWCRGKGDARAWLIPPETWRTVFTAGYDPTTVARTLAERGMLIRDGQQLSRAEWVDGRTHRVYVLTAKILHGESPSKPTSEGSGAPAPKAPLTLEDLSKLL